MKIRKPIITRLCAAVTALAILPASISLQAFAAPEGDGEPINWALGQSYTKSVPPSAGGDYMDALREDTDNKELTDGIVGAPDYWNDYNWVHWLGQPVDIVVDLGDERTFDTFEIVALSHAAGLYVLPSVVNISVSSDNATWDDIHSGTLPRDLTTDTAYTYSYKNPTSITGRYVKFSLPTEGEWNLIGEIRVLGTPELGDAATPIIDVDLEAAKSAAPGDEVTFSVSASTSDSGVLSYQWYKDDVVIEGATEATYTIASLAAEDEGSYKVVVTNIKGDSTATATSTVCTLTVEGADTNWALNMPYTKSTEPSADGSYMDAMRADQDNKQLTDGIVGLPDYWNDYNWVHYIGKPVDVVVDLGEDRVFNAFEIVMMRYNSGGLNITLPSAVNISYSSDNVTWQEVHSGSFPTDVAESTAYTYSYRHPASVKGRYVKFSLPAEGEWNLLGEVRVLKTSDAPEYEEAAVPTFDTDLEATKTAKLGKEATFAVLASTSDGGTLSYQWYKDDVAIEGATEATYTIASVTSEDAGSYKVVAVNTKGHATATATSTVCALTIDGGISYTNIALNKPYTKSAEPVNAGVYPDTDDKELTDGIVGAPDLWNDYNWVCWIEPAVDIVVDLESVQNFDGFELIAMRYNFGGTDIQLPSIIEFSYSSDNVTWTKVHTGKFPTDLTTSTAYTYHYTHPVSMTGRYVKFSLPMREEWKLVSEIRVLANQAESNAAKPTFTKDLPSYLYVEEGTPASLSGEAAATDGGTITYQWYKDNNPIDGATSAEYTISSCEESDSGAYMLVATNTKNGETAKSGSTVCALTVQTKKRRNLALNRSYTMTMGATDFSFLNPDDNGKEMTDGIHGEIAGDFSYQTAPWLGWIGGKSATFEFDLGGIAQIDEVTTHVYPYPHWGIDYATGYKVEISTNNWQWITIHDDSEAYEKEWLTFETDTPVSARFVRVTVFYGFMTLIDEIEIYGIGGRPELPAPDPDTVMNLAVNRPYYLHAEDANGTPQVPALQAQWPDSGEMLTDGAYAPSSDWQADQSKWVSWRKTGSDLTVSAEIDLGSQKAVEEVMVSLLNQSTYGLTLPSDIQIAVSNSLNTDNLDWITVYQGAVQDDGSGTGLQKVICTLPQTVRARFVRVILTQRGEYMAMDEIEVIGKGDLADAIDPIDLFTKDLLKLSDGRAYLSSETDSSYPDSGTKLTDGVYGAADMSDPAWTGFHFVNQPTKTVEMDFGEIRYINRISMNFLYDGEKSITPPSRIQFAVSEDGKNWTAVYDSRGVADSNSTYKHQYFSIKPVKAQYVMFYLYSTSEWAFADELEIWGDSRSEPSVVIPVDPPKPEKQPGFAYPGSDTAGIRNLAVLDAGLSWTAKALAPYFTYQGSAVGDYSMFDGVAVTGSPSDYPALLQKLSETGKELKIVLALPYESGGNMDEQKRKTETALNSLLAMTDAYENLTLVGILLTNPHLTDTDLVDYSAQLIHNEGLKVFWLPSADAEGLSSWQEHGIDSAACNSAVSATAYEHNLGLLIKAPADRAENAASYESYLDILDRSVSEKFQGRYIFRAYNLGLWNLETEMGQKAYEGTCKMMEGLLKTSSRNVPDSPSVAQFASRWVSLDSTQGYEYSMDGIHWTKDFTFRNLSPETEYHFYQRIAETNGLEASLMSAALTVTTPEAPTEAEPMVPTFTTNLATSKSAQAGDNVTLTVAASVSDGGTLSYQWYKDDQAISGATSASYTFNSIQKSDEGSYKVVVTNTLSDKTATATSNVCVITVEVPVEPMAPSFTSNLSSSKAAQTDDQVTFAVKAMSNNNGTLSYQWYKNGQAIAGATSDSYTIASASLSDGGVYYVEVTDKSNNTHTLSNSCTLTVTEKGTSSGGSTGGSGGGGSYHPSTPSTGNTDTDGWKQLSDGSWQYRQNGRPVSGWQTIEGKSYVFNSAGVMQTGWYQENGKWFYLGSSGTMRTGWQEIDHKWYYLNTDGSMATGWLKSQNVWYYLKADGSMATGWLHEGGVWYWLYDWGGMANTAWVKVNGAWYYFRGNGRMHTGWLQLESNWYYLTSTGAMTANRWHWVGNHCYYFYESGVMAASTTVNGYRVDNNGVWIS